MLETTCASKLHVRLKDWRCAFYCGIIIIISSMSTEATTGLPRDARYDAQWLKWFNYWGHCVFFAAVNVNSLTWRLRPTTADNWSPGLSSGNFLHVVCFSCFAMCVKVYCSLATVDGVKFINLLTVSVKVAQLLVGRGQTRIFSCHQCCFWKDWNGSLWRGSPRISYV